MPSPTHLSCGQRSTPRLLSTDGRKCALASVSVTGPEAASRKHCSSAARQQEVGAAMLGHGRAERIAFWGQLLRDASTATRRGGYSAERRLWHAQPPTIWAVLRMDDGEQRPRLPPRRRLCPGRPVNGQRLPQRQQAVAHGLPGQVLGQHRQLAGAALAHRPHLRVWRAVADGWAAEQTLGRAASAHTQPAGKSIPGEHSLARSIPPCTQPSESGRAGRAPCRRTALQRRT